jgi:hypothetical protein
MHQTLCNFFEEFFLPNNLDMQHCNVLIPKKIYTLEGIKPGMFCSVAGRDDHYALPPGHIM